MDLQENLLESSNRKKKGAGKFSIASLALHALIVAFILFMSAATATHRVDAERKIQAFVTNAPPPPPPPPPAGSSAPHPATPKPTIKPVEVPHFVQPTQIPKELPKVEASMTKVADVTPSQPSAPSGGEQGGVPGGVVGGVAGGVQGGVVGGQVGGQIGGVLGGTGTGEATPEPPPPPEPKPEGPLRVGGDVKAPTVIHRVEPQYTDIARKAHVTGVVIVEAIIDKDG